MNTSHGSGPFSQLICSLDDEKFEFFTGDVIIAALVKHEEELFGFERISIHFHETSRDVLHVDFGFAPSKRGPDRGCVRSHLLILAPTLSNVRETVVLDTHEDLAQSLSDETKVDDVGFDEVVEISDDIEFVVSTLRAWANVSFHVLDGDELEEEALSEDDREGDC